MAGMACRNRADGNPRWPGEGAQKDIPDEKSFGHLERLVVGRVDRSGWSLPSLADRTTPPRLQRSALVEAGAEGQQLVEAGNRQKDGFAASGLEEMAQVRGKLPRGKAGCLHREVAAE